ncbi:MAG: hypothetical protein GX319_02225 [Clostridiales bacterium]|nr:hypothetical protein [Clostridiales bacterium]
MICTPNQIEELLVGYLYGENIINCLDDIISININRQKHQALYDEFMECGDHESYSIRTKEDVIKVIENSINNIDDNNKFAYSFNHLSISLIMSLQYKDGKFIHERECALLRKDELVVESAFYKIY